MRRSLVLEFTKMNGAGNDFIVLDNRFYYFTDADLSRLAARYCPRRTGVGADGLLALSDSTEGLHYRMRYFNADGSRGTMCGNGARCLARFAYAAGIHTHELAFETDAGPYRAYVPADAGEAVRLGLPAPEAFRLPDELGLEGVYGIWTGTEHAVVFVDDVAQADVAGIGARLRRHDAFAPQGTNVNFVQVETKGGNGQPARVRMRTFEKGVEGETMACGTGATAAAAVARLTERTEAEATRVEMPGGALLVGLPESDGGFARCYLEGPAETTFRGSIEIEPEWLSG